MTAEYIEDKEQVKETINSGSFIADMHTHTVASTHAFSTITENAHWAAHHGIKYLGMTDHGIKMQDSPDTWHFENLRVLPDILEGVRVFKGIEANILDTEGSLDIVKDFYYYDILEWVNVSMHVQTFTPSTKSEHTKAYLNVLKNPYVDVICHSERANFDYDFDEVCRACSQLGRLMEVNVSRLERGSGAAERYKAILDVCVRHGTRIIVNSDAHFYTHIGAFEPAAELLNEIGFPGELIVNCDESRFLGYVNERKNRTGKQ